MNTTLGHMHQQQKNVQSTRLKSTINITAPESPLEPIPVSMHHLYTNTFDTFGKIYTYLPGRFPILSNSGNCYLLILYYDRNLILSELIKNCSDYELVGAYTKIVDHIKERGSKPKVYILDNEASTALK